MCIWRATINIGNYEYGRGMFHFLKQKFPIDFIGEYRDAGGRYYKVKTIPDIAGGTIYTTNPLLRDESIALKEESEDLFDYLRDSNVGPFEMCCSFEEHYNLSDSCKQQTFWYPLGFEAFPRFASMRASVNTPGVPINDHMCPTCKNDRCSKSETTCWKCGNKL